MHWLTATRETPSRSAISWWVKGMVSKMPSGSGLPCCSDRESRAWALSLIHI